VTVGATQTASTSSKADASATGGTVAIGLALALAIVDDSVTAGTDRNVSAGGAVGFSAAGSSGNATEAIASVKGAEGKKDSTDGGTDNSNKDVNQKANDQLGNANTQRNKTPKTTTTPDAKSGENGGTKVTVAGAVAINVIDTVSRASVADGLSVSNSAGTLTVASSANTDASAKADGKATGTGGATLGIGAAVAIDLVTVVNEALIGAGATLNVHGLTLSATMKDVSGDQKHVLLADSTSGAGGGKVGISGSLALTIADIKTTAELKQSTSTLNGGDVALTATSSVESTDNAKAKDTGAGTVGIGAARRSTSSTR
jgi:hypothetical protein